MAFVRTLVTAARSYSMYDAQHPTAQAAIQRCRATIGALVAHAGLVIGVTPQTLLANGEPIVSDARIQEGCALLNNHDIRAMRIVALPSPIAVGHFLTLLGFDAEAVRRRGGPARIWADYGHGWLQIEQIDYDRLLANTLPGPIEAVRRGSPADRVAQPAPIERDHVWQSLVRAIGDGRGSLDVQAERRLMDIAHSAEAIAELAADAARAQTAEGAALEAARAAALLMTFQRLSSYVEMHAPQDLDGVTANIAEAAARAAPAVLVGAAAESAESGLGADMVRAIGRQFDDDRVAQVVAGALTERGQEPARIATALQALVPDPARRQRVLHLARVRAGHSSARPADDVSSALASLERLLAGPADEAYVSRLYGGTIAQAEARSNRLRLDAPARLDEWMRSVSAESVRASSATVLIDLFALETTPATLFETARDLAQLAEDLLLADDRAEAERVVQALALAAGGPDAQRAAAARAALETIAAGGNQRIGRLARTALWRES
jgi:hypothetical protein